MESEAPLPSRLTFSYMFPLLRIGYRRPLEHADLAGMLEPRDTAAASSASLHRHLPASPAPLAPRLRAALARRGGDDRAAAGLGKLMGDLLGFIQPLAVAGVLNFLALRRAGKSDALWGAPGLQLERNAHQHASQEAEAARGSKCRGNPRKSRRIRP